MLKRILDTLVPSSDRDFTVEIVAGRHRRRRIAAQYRVIDKSIKTYGEFHPLTIVALGVHELAHHVARKRGYGGHGKGFIDTLDKLVRLFNLGYAESMKMDLNFDKRQPSTKMLFFIKREKTEHHGNIRVERG